MGNNFVVVSPDGSLRSANGQNDIFGVEFKCPVRQMQDEVPQRYLLQCLSEMEVLQVDKLLYICWRPDVTSVFEITRNQDLFIKVLDNLLAVYCQDKPKKPTKLPSAIAEIREEIQRECRKAKFCGEVPSITNIQDRPTPNKDHTKPEAVDLLYRIAQLLSDGYELRREKASEAMVFLCCDLDRNWSKEQIRWAPVCWFPKGYSLTCKVFRNIVEEVHNNCHKAGIHIPCSSFDGQWHTLAVRDANGKPLTILQLQKDVWCESCKLQKTEILKIFCTLNTIYRYNKDHLTGRIVMSNGGSRLPVLSNRALRQSVSDTSTTNKDDNEEESHASISQKDVIPECIQSDNIVDENLSVLLQVPIHRDVAAEMETCNILDMEAAAEVPIAPDEDNLIPDMMSNIFNEKNIDASTPRPSTSLSNCFNKFIIDVKDAQSILSLLKSDTQANNKGIWEDRDYNFIIESSQSTDKLEKLRDCDLRVFLSFLKRTRVTNVNPRVNKEEKLKALFEILGLSGVIKHKSQRKNKIHHVRSLKDHAQSVLSGKNVPKRALNIAYTLRL